MNKRVIVNLILFVAMLGILLWLIIRLSEPNSEAVLAAIALVSGAVVAILRLLLGKSQFTVFVSNLGNNTLVSLVLIGLTVVSSIGLIVNLQSFVTNDTSVPNIKIVDWSGLRSFDKLIMTMSGCRDSNTTSNITISKPAYFVIFKVYAIFTFVNDSSIGDGIIKVETPYENIPVTRLSQFPIWYLTINDPNESALSSVQLPIPIPPRIPEKYGFDAFHLVETQPTVPAASFYDYARSLSPIVWTFTTLEDVPLVYRTEFIPAAPEAINTGYFDFGNECNTLVPRWPLPVLGTQISS